MITEWSSHISDPEKQEEFESLVRNSTIVLGRLHDIIQKKIDTLNKRKLSDEGFKDPNWALMQANHLGKIKQLLDIQKLTEFSKDKIK
jgi:hypothetical protein